MTFKEARAEARKLNRAYISLSKQKEIGWYAEKYRSNRSIYLVEKNGELKLLNTEFAKQYKRGK